MQTINPKDISAKAAEFYTNGLCCSEAVICAMAEAYNADPSLYVRIGSGLCGGLGSGLVCGVVSAGACGIGLFLGRDNSNQPRSIAPNVSAEFVTRFSKVHNCIECNKLLASHTKGSVEQKKHCANIVATGVEIACNLINEKMTSDI